MPSSATGCLSRNRKRNASTWTIGHVLRWSRRKIEVVGRFLVQNLEALFRSHERAVTGRRCSHTRCRPLGGWYVVAKTDAVDCPTFTSSIIRMEEARSMKTVIAVVVGLAVGSICTLATQAQAPRQSGCGWVLWARGNGQDWNANSGHDTYAACKRRGAALNALFSEGVTNLKDAREFSCFPSEIDPRHK